MSNSIEKIVRISIVIVAAILLVIISAIDILIPKLYLESNYIEVGVNSTYKGIIYSATINGKDVSDRVKIDGIVDTTHIGEYKQTYHIKNGMYETKSDLIVKVVDIIPPKISVDDDIDEFEICKDNDITKIKFRAIDNYDGDITNNVKVYKDLDKVIYEVSDYSGNTTKKEVNLKASMISPTITLNGEDTIYVKQNSTYNEPGATATDSCGNDISSDIRIIGSVDTSNMGEYDLTYIATDNNGLIQLKNRKVIVYDEKETLGTIYLTFDDGPSSLTPQILDILKKYDIKATFFVTKYGNDEDILREYNEGHTVGLHTYTHNFKIYKSTDAYFEDLNLIKERVKKITGVESHFIRFPGGSSNTVSKAYSKGIMSTLTKMVEENGYKYFDWNVCIEDAGACAKKKVHNKEACVINYFKSGLSKTKDNYVLMHDVKEYTLNALEEMIIYAKDNNYQFLPITDDTPVHHHHLNN